MKIRQGFVSNSSSSSFVALGFSVVNVKNPYKEVITNLGVTCEEFDKEVGKVKEEYDYMSTDDAIQEVCFETYYEILKNANIRILQGRESGVDKDDKVIALMLAETDSNDGGGFAGGEIVVNEKNDDYAEICRLRNAINPDAEIRILYGSRCC